MAVVLSSSRRSLAGRTSSRLLAYPIANRELRCGYVDVAMDRGKATSPTVRLPVVVAHGNADVPRPDPILVLGGGFSPVIGITALQPALPRAVCGP